MIKLAVSGSQGRMGQCISTLAQNDPELKLNTLLEHSVHPKINEQFLGLNINADNSSIEGNDALIEFTLPEGTIENLRACVKYNVPMVIGTTGFNAEQIAEIKAASQKIPIVFASNMSIGVNVFFKLIEIAAKNLAGLEDISIGETHHIHKKDAPSGTAKTMKEIVDQFASLKARFDEEKIKREGEVVGYHEITFETDCDTLTIIHNAKNREMFAKGSLKAAKFIAGKESGLFHMQEILGLDKIK